MLETSTPECDLVESIPARVCSWALVALHAGGWSIFGSSVNKMLGAPSLNRPLIQGWETTDLKLSHKLVSPKLL